MKIPHQLASWTVDEIIEALSFTKAFGWGSQESKDVDRELMKLAPDAYSDRTPLSDVWDRLPRAQKMDIIKAYNTDVYGKNDPIKINESKSRFRSKIRRVVQEEIRRISKRRR